ncbi:MAG: GAF domain-containing sensor histidine kinase [Alphaproteobacteria bacterium]|nr:GAF domain-containing sensor histidine kinase [Alphaproteobacteria bacterium]
MVKRENITGLRTGRPVDPVREGPYLRILNEFSIRLIGIPSQSDLLWYVAREVVGKFGFVDCVIYLLDEDRRVLRQEAAIGEKNPYGDTIENVLEIPIGQGITGHVAQTKTPIVVGNLSEDERYIPDIKAAQSEICVPLLANDRVLGVIDCEDPRPDWFGEEHLQILTTIATMTSAKLLLLRDVEDRQRVEQDLVIALEAAEAASRAKSDFLAGMSHELRTPLNAIIGFSDLIESEIIGPIGNEKYKDYANSIKISGEHLLKIIGDILDISRIESGKIDLDESVIFLKEIIDECVNMEFSSKEDDTASMTVVVSPDADRIWADVLLVKQMVLNLLSNARKFTPATGRISVRVARGGRGGVALEVADTGVGIPAESLGDIAQPFTRFHEDHLTSSSDRSFGLGLSLVKKFAALHGATFSVQSTLGKGTTVTIGFPPERTVRD